MRKKLLKIINHYGIRHQLKHLNSEVFELNEAILDAENVSYNVGHIAEELADVFVMLTQIKEYYRINTELLQEIMKYKINRTLDRMESVENERKV